MSALPQNPYGEHTNHQVLSVQNLLDALDYAEGVEAHHEVQLIVDELMRRGMSHLVLA